MVEIRRIEQDNPADLNIPNEPFSMPGKFIPALCDGVWSYRIEPFAQEQTMCFPDFAYDPVRVNQDGFALGAYEDGACIGVAVFQNAFFKYMYLTDLKVNASARGKGAGKALVQAGLREACRRNYRGIYLTAQDNNLNACMFYLKCGFSIGGFDNRVYAGTSQEGKGNIEFYLDCAGGSL